MFNLELHKPVRGKRGGAEVEHHRREDSGAEGAEEGKAWGECPLPIGVAVPPPQKKMILGLDMMSFGAFLVAFLQYSSSP